MTIPLHLLIPIFITVFFATLACKAFFHRGGAYDMTPILGIICMLPIALTWAIYFAVLYFLR